MKLISHRGNINGPEPDKENDPSHIEMAISGGYDVEIDVWKIGATLWLGHDLPQFTVNPKFLRNEHLLCHAKNLEALDFMLKLGDVHCFWHQEDQYTLTNKGYIVSYPGYAVTPKTICMKPELVDIKSVYDCYAVCSDYIECWDGRRNEP
jgi:hypothetical protein